LKVFGRFRFRFRVLMPDGRGLGSADTAGTADSKSGVECEGWNGVLLWTAGAIVSVGPFISWPAASMQDSGKSVCSFALRSSWPSWFVVVRQILFLFFALS